MDNKEKFKDLYEAITNIQDYQFEDIITDELSDDDDIYAYNIFDDVDMDITLSGIPENDPDDITIEDRILKLSDELAEEIIIYNILDQIDNNNFLYDKTNYINLFIDKYKKLKYGVFSEPIDDQQKKEIINNIASNLIEVVLTKLEDKYGVSLSYDIDNETILLEALEDLAAVYEFFVIRNKENIVDIFIDDLDSELVLNPFITRIENVESTKDVFIKEDLKKNVDKRLIAVTYFAPEIIDVLATQNSDSLYALMHRIINLDYYEEINMKINELLTTKFGSVFVITDHDTEAAKKYFGITYDDITKANIATDIINKYRQKLELEKESI